MPGCGWLSYSGFQEDAGGGGGLGSQPTSSVTPPWTQAGTGETQGSQALWAEPQGPVLDGAGNFPAVSSGPALTVPQTQSSHRQAGDTGKSLGGGKLPGLLRLLRAAPTCGPWGPPGHR